MKHQQIPISAKQTNNKRMKMKNNKASNQAFGLTVALFAKYQDDAKLMLLFILIVWFFHFAYLFWMLAYLFLLF